MYRTIDKYDETSVCDSKSTDRRHCVPNKKSIRAVKKIIQRIPAQKQNILSLVMKIASVACFLKNDFGLAIHKKRTDS